MPQSFFDGVSFPVPMRSRLCCLVFRRRFATTFRDIAVESFALVQDAGTDLDEGTAAGHAELVESRDSAAEILRGFLHGEKVRGHGQRFFPATDGDAMDMHARLRPRLSSGAAPPPPST